MVHLSRRQKFRLLLGAIVVGLIGLYLSASYVSGNAAYYASRLQGTLGKEQVQQHFRQYLARRIPVFGSTSDDVSAVQLSIQAVAGNSSNYEEDFGASFRPSPLDLNAKAVILFSYMRAGSSFLGDVLFNLDSSVFYAFETLAPLYMAMYGLEASSVIDTDLIFWPNGSRRQFPAEEVKAITWMLSHLLTCNMTSFPLEVYSHHFWKWSHNLYQYQMCMEDRQLVESSRSCQGYLQPVCGNKFGEPHSDVDLCFQNRWVPFWKKIHNISNAEKSDGLNANSAHNRLFYLYDACLGGLWDAVNSCLPYLQNSCQKASLRATKLVRGSMATLEGLLNLMPNLYVIHLYRDPRAVVRSRRTIDWSQGQYDGDDLAKLAETYCRRVAMDTRSRKALLKKYPDRLLEVVYDKVVESPLPSIRRIFRFLDREIPEQSLVYLEATADEFRSYKERWTYEMNETDKTTIERTCEEFAKTTGFDWRHFDVPLDSESRH